ncbi:hypothetical protein E2C01_030939 [Portunus trituberculatus]|uniref:Uncharacterized protein n=1 Tax=Portunus trituberculatus TaxID=210409 RepID=A0A5B7ERR4_PORTR|nr:hypothetical protein [Portunus trituberculatus]
MHSCTVYGASHKLCIFGALLRIVESNLRALFKALFPQASVILPLHCLFCELQVTLHSVMNLRAYGDKPMDELQKERICNLPPCTVWHGGTTWLGQHTFTT